MTRRLPLVPTIIVGLAARGDDRARHLAAAARGVEGAAARAICRRRRSCRRSPGRRSPCDGNELPLFRHATGVCLRPVGKRAVAGHNRGGRSGYAHIVDCVTGAEGPG